MYRSAPVAVASIGAVIMSASGKDSAHTATADHKKGWLKMRLTVFEMGMFWIFLIVGAVGLMFAIQVGLEFGKIFVDWVTRK